MPVNGYSTYASYLSNVNGFQRLQTSLATLTQQLNSGRKSSDLTTYGVETQRLVDLRAEIARRHNVVPLPQVRTEVLEERPRIRSAIGPMTVQLTTALLGRWNAQVVDGEPIEEVAAAAAQELLVRSGRIAPPEDADA